MVSTRSPRGIETFFRRKPLGAMGGVLIGLLVLAALFAPFLAPYDPYEIRALEIFVPPGHKFWLGTDDFGRDVFSRIIYGARISLYVGLLSVGLGTTMGALIGLISGYWGGTIDDVLQRVMDSLLAFPSLILALAIVAALGQSTTNVIIAVAITTIPSSARVIRASVLSVRTHLYVEAGRALGAPETRLLFAHILPNCFAPYIVLATTALGNAILAEAALSFLGLGTPPPEPSWGTMLSGGAQSYVWQAPWMAIFPGVAISLAVYGFNLFGDALRDLLDPRLKG